jgi:hypothetical protein
MANETSTDREPFVFWGYKGEWYRSPIVAGCTVCGVRAVIRLPDAVRAEQPDDTTHVCAPMAGGCNHGFSDLPSGDG